MQNKNNEFGSNFNLTQAIPGVNPNRFKKMYPMNENQI